MSQITTSERKWTRGQTAAINIRNKTLLVSAAAGSGKTATLTERIIRSLTDKEAPSDISKMLIVTFTRAAATELRDRIFSALSKELAKDPTSRHLNEQLIKLGGARICTIDAFYLDLIRQNFSALGISASARIADQSELDILKKTVMDETIDAFYDKDESFPSFAECFIRTKSIYMLAEPLLGLYDSVSSCPEGLEFLSASARSMTEDADAGKNFFETPYGESIRRELIARFEYYARVLGDAARHSEENAETIGKRTPCYTYEADFSEKIYAALSDTDVQYDKVRDIFASYSPPKMGSIKRGEQESTEGLFYKNERKKIKEDIDELCEKIFSRSNADVCDELRQTAAHTDMLYRVLSEFSARLSEEKRRRGIMDFDDVKRYTLRLLVNDDRTPTELAKKYREQFTDIYIDEYQDVDLVQDLIFSSISKNNRFMVGDIKQSIYGFRGAEPKVFANYREKFYSLDTDVESEPPEGVDAATIFMSENFRCDSNIIKFTNLVCSRIFRASADSIGYTEADDLRFSKALPSEDYISPRAEVAVILTKDTDGEDDAENDDAPKKKRRRRADDEPDKEELEAEYIAGKIASLVGKKRLANGKLIAPGDIAILYRSGKMVSYLSEALAKRGILCSEGGGDSYLESPDVLLVLSLLNVVDNPHRDIHLTATLCSPLFEFSLDELIVIRRSASSAYSLYDAVLGYAKGEDALADKCRRFDETLCALRTSSLSLPVDRFLRLLFESNVFVASGLLADRNDFGEGGSLMRLYDYARTFESGSFKGLYNFIEFINTLIENGKLLEVAPKDRCAERVTLTTMHHSKGLEFPVCFICGTGTRKNMRELHGSLLYEYPTGVAMKLSDSTGLARINTPLREAIAKNKFIGEIEEEMRILYVALTRARERLYVTATSNATPEKLMLDAEMRVRYGCRYTLSHCTSFIDWLLIPFADRCADLSCCSLRFVTPKEYLDSVEASAEQDARKREKTVERDEALYTHLREKLAFRYGYSELTRIPAKLSVSRLSPDILDENDTSAELSAETRTRIPDFFISGNISKASSAERGTATHLFLQFCDFKRARASGIAEELARLTEKRFIPENVAELVYVEELERFLDSELAERIYASADMIREQRFNVLLPASVFTQSAELRGLLSDESLAVQGVIDLILIDESGDVELYDYKTDRLSRAELSDDSAAAAKMNAAHGLQLSYYAHAVEMLFGRKCKRMCVYSTCSARLYDIDVVPLRLAEIEK